MLEKWLCLAAFLVAAILVLASVLDLAIGIPFGKQSLAHDIIFAIAGAIVCWQAFEVWRQIA